MSRRGKNSESELADDLLYGAAAIAEFVFGAEDERRKVYALAESGQLPVFRLGATSVLESPASFAILRRASAQPRQRIRPNKRTAPTRGSRRLVQ